MLAGRRSPTKHALCPTGHVLRRGRLKVTDRPPDTAAVICQEPASGRDASRATCRDTWDTHNRPNGSRTPPVTATQAVHVCGNPCLSVTPRPLRRAAAAQRFGQLLPPCLGFGGAMCALERRMRTGRRQGLPGEGRRRAGRHRNHLNHAPASASAQSLPTIDVVLAFARACGADLREQRSVRQLWWAARPTATRRDGRSEIGVLNKGDCGGSVLPVSQLAPACGIVWQPSPPTKMIASWVVGSSQR